ncbi:MAG: hypothetical protein Q4G02_03065 [bacterium]|nr:hypothetical protein [bacterium]
MKNNQEKIKKVNARDNKVVRLIVIVVLILIVAYMLYSLGMFDQLLGI